MNSSNEVSQSQSSVPVEVEVNASGALAPEHPATPTSEPPAANNSPATREYEFHPYAELFLMLPDSELRKMARDIKATGLHEPIWLYQGKILDGRNRYKACLIAGVEPEFRDYAGDNPAGFVFSVNFHRRHLSISQRAALAVEFLPIHAAEAKARQQKHGGTAPGRGANTGGTNATSARSAESGKARDKAAKQAGVSPRYVSDAKKVQMEDPALLKAVQRGTKTLPAAMREIEKRNKASGSDAGGNGTTAPVAGYMAILVLVHRDGDKVRTEVLGGPGTDSSSVATALSRACSGLRKDATRLEALPQDVDVVDALASFITLHPSPAMARPPASPQCVESVTGVGNAAKDEAPKAA